MRILLSIHHELDRDAGAPGATLRLGEALRGLGHEVDFLSFDDMKPPDGTKRYRFPWFVAREIARRPRYDVYDLSSGDGWVASLAQSIRRGTRKSLIVARSHGLEHVLHDTLVSDTKANGGKLSWKYPVYNGGYRLWECRRSFASAGLALFLNQSDQDYAVSNLGVERERAGVVKNGVADNFIDHAAGIEGALAEVGGPTHVAFIGSYIDRKGIRFLAEAMAEVMRQNEDVHLGLFGTGIGAETILNDYPPELHSRIEVTPRYTNARLPDMIAPYHILAFPSLSEGFPLAPAEAMACGLVPVIADIPGSSAIVQHEVNGLSVPAADSAALRAAIERLLHDHPLWRRLRLKAVSDIKSYAWRTVAADAAARYSAHLAPA